MAKKLLLLFVVLLVASGLNSCGSDSTSVTSDEKKPASAEKPKEEELLLYDDYTFNSTVRYAANPDGSRSFLVTEASASPGKVSFEFVNPQRTPHTVAIEDPQGKTIARTKPIKNGKTTIEVQLKEGVYVLYCSIPGHRKAGMTGHLTVAG